MTAETLIEQQPGVPIGHVAHSVGGHFVGRMDNAALQSMLNYYSAARRELVHRTPASFGVKTIGHNGPFSRATLPAAQEIWSWLIEKSAMSEQTHKA